MALPLSEVFSQHLPSPLDAAGLNVQWVQAGFLKHRRAQVSWLIPRLLLRLFPEYFTFFSMTHPGRGERDRLYHLRIPMHQQQEWQFQIQEKCGSALMKIFAPRQSPELPWNEFLLLWITLIWYQVAGLRLEIRMSAPGLALLLTELHSSFPRSLCLQYKTCVIIL